MTNEQNNTPPSHRPIIHNDEVDLLQLVKTLWVGRKTIYYSVGMCILLGLVIGFFGPVKYKATTTLLLSEEKKGGNLGNLGTIAGMAGINLSSMMGDADGIPAELYPQIVGSYPFKKELINQKYNFEKFDKPISIYDFVYQDSSLSIGEALMKYTIQLPKTIKESYSSPGKNQNSENYDYGVLKISEDEQSALDFLDDIIQIEVDEETGLVSVILEMEEPVLVAQVTQGVVNLLQQYIIDYKTEQVTQNLLFVEERYLEKKQEFEVSQKAFFEYKDSHRNMVSERVDIEYQELSDAYDIAGTVYKGLAQQWEQAKIKVKEETPIFTVLEPAIVPDEKSAPNKKLILVVSILLGGMIGVGVILGKIIIRKFE